ncbi:MAG: cytochrome c oxidase subunit II [Ardenticatenaceae bacterium]|nr:cytochrome c oxidase subunit II [Ardenticatenaceae bacterium]
MFQLPVRASAEGTLIDTMFQGHFWMISFLFALIMVIMLYAVVVFRRRPGDETEGPHVHGSTVLEIIWTVVPVVAVIGFGVWGTVTLGQLLEAKPNEMVIEVTGKQWQWSFSYPEQDVKSPQLYLPVNQPVVLQMTSQDVLHSFWVPEFRVKQDLVPGRTTTLRFTPTLAGDYKVRCAEICGLEHANMLADVRVVSETEFASWVEERSVAIQYADLTPEQRGDLWHGAEGDGGFGCNSCHSIDGSTGAGPTWLGLYGRQETLTDGSTITVDEEYIRNSILHPNDQIVSGFNRDVMPQNYEELFAAKQAEILASDGIEIDIIADLIAYIQTLEE